MMVRLVVAGIVMLLSLISPRALACASCGSGGDDPLILYPWENFKIYAGFARSEGFTLLDTAGRESFQLAPDARNTTTISVGHTFSNRLFSTLTAPYIVNKRDSYERSGWGDPMMTVRYTILTQDISVDWQPQIQAIAAVRSGNATSVYDYRDPAMLDVFGSGVPEGRLGIDVWHGMFDWKAGFAQTVTAPLAARRSQIGEVKNGVALRSTLTIGYGWSDLGKVIFGVNREQTTKKTIDGEAWANSDTLAHSAFLSADAKIEQHSNVRLTVSRVAAFGAARNTSRSDTVTMAVMRAF
jgi:hypothetical protein